MGKLLSFCTELSTSFSCKSSSYCVILIQRWQMTYVSLNPIGCPSPTSIKKSILLLMHKVYYETMTQSTCELFSKRVTSRSSRVPNQFNIIRFKSETGRNTLQYRGPVIWNFVNRLPVVKVPDNSYSVKQILRKHVKIIDNFSFDKGATLVANKKDDFIYF